MVQYTIISAAASIVLDDGTDTFRYKVVDGVLFIDQGIIGTDFWGRIGTYADSGGGVWRLGVRDLHWRVDCTITGLGYSGEENTDWENIESAKLKGVAAGSPFTADSSLTIDSSKTIDSSRI